MKPFKTKREAIQWANQVTSAGRWVNVVVLIQDFGQLNYFHLRTGTAYVNGRQALKTFCNGPLYSPLLSR